MTTTMTTETTNNVEQCNDYTDNVVELRMLEFFSGIGGMRLALESAIDILNKNSNQNNKNKRQFKLTYCRAYDISLHANHCYQHNFHPAQKEDKETTANNVIDGTVCTKLIERLKPTEIDKLQTNIWTMSPPCQPFTTNGGPEKQQLDSEDERCNGFKGVINILDTIQNKPQYILLENVKGFGTSQMIQAFYTSLQRNGYDYQSYLISPIQFGIPNHRQRFYVLCTRRNEKDSPNENHHRHRSNDHNQDPITNIDNLKHYNNRVTDQQPQMVAEYIDWTINNRNVPTQYVVPDSILQKNWANNLGIVTESDTATHCFTAGYGRIYHRSTGSLLLLPPETDESSPQQSTTTTSISRCTIRSI